MRADPLAKKYSESDKKLTSDLEKKMIEDVMRTITNAKELVCIGLSDADPLSRHLSTLSIVLTAGMASLTSAATLMRVMTKPRDSSRIIFDNEDMANAIGYLIALMTTRLSVDKISIKDLEKLSTDVSEALKPFINISALSDSH